MRKVLRAFWACVLLGGGALGAGGCAKRDPSVSYAEPVGTSGSGISTSVSLEARAGTPRGHIQIPKGGQPGTTSLERPTYEEVGVDVAWAPAGDLRFAWGRHHVHLGGASWVLHGQDTLRQGLTTHQDVYAAGTPVTSASEIAEAWLGYGYAFNLSPCVSVAPGLGIYAHRVAYDLSGGGNSSTRDFDAFSPMLEAELLWRTGGCMHLSANLRLVLDDLLGLTTPTRVVEAEVRWHLDLWSRGDVYLAVGGMHVAHHDDQPVPNDTLLEVVPWFGLGGEFRF